MKKLIIVAALLLALIPGTIFAAGSCITSGMVSHNYYEGTTAVFSGVRSITFTCTADASDNTYPSTAFSTNDMNKITGWYLLMGETYNGATAPTALWDIALTNALGVDILGTGGANRPGTAASNSQFTPLTDTVYATPGLRPVTSALTLAVSGNAVASAIATITFIFIKP